MRPVTIPLQERKTGENLCYPGLSNDFSDTIPKAQSIKEKKIGLHQAYELLFKRHHDENEKASHRLEGNICKS